MFDMMTIPERLSRAVWGEEATDAELSSACETDAGTRKSNDDRFFRSDDAGVFLVVDGIGGHFGGGIASQLTSRTLASALCELVNRGSTFGIDDLDATLAAGMSECSQSMGRLEQSIARYQHMGCTFGAAVIKGDRLYCTGVGCVRVYLMRAGRLKQLSEDQSLAHELVKAHALDDKAERRHCWKHIITNSLSSTGTLTSPVWKSCQLRKGDRLLLCSNGLTDVLTDAQLASVLTTQCAADEASGNLIQAAKDAGNKHNTTCLVVAVDEREMASMK